MVLRFFIFVALKPDFVATASLTGRRGPLTRALEAGAGSNVDPRLRFVAHCSEIRVLFTAGTGGPFTKLRACMGKLRRR